MKKKQFKFLYWKGFKFWREMRTIILSICGGALAFTLYSSRHPAIPILFSFFFLIDGGCHFNWWKCFFIKKLLLFRSFSDFSNFRNFHFFSKKMHRKFQLEKIFSKNGHLECISHQVHELHWSLKKSCLLSFLRKSMYVFDKIKLCTFWELSQVQPQSMALMILKDACLFWRTPENCNFWEIWHFYSILR